MSGTGLAASDPVRGRGREARWSCGRGAETAAGLQAGPVLVALSELPGLLIQVTAWGSSPCRCRGLEQRCRYQTLARSRGAANVQPSQTMQGHRPYLGLGYMRSTVMRHTPRLASWQEEATCGRTNGGPAS